MSNANVSNLFSIDNSKINQEMNELVVLEDYVNHHAGVNLSDVQLSNQALTENILPIEASPLSQQNALSGGGAMGIPSFLWGCCLGPIGVAVVFFSTNDNHETLISLLGCLVFGLFWWGSWYWWLPWR